MSDLLFPTNLIPARSAFRYLDSTGVSIGEYTGAKLTASKGGDRLAASLEFVSEGGRTDGGRFNRAAMQAFLASLRGRQNRFYIYDHSYTKRGSFPSFELLSNATFENGTTGWLTGSSANMTITAQDRRLRLLRTGMVSTTLRRTAAATTVAFAPYVARAFVMQGRGPVLYSVRIGTTVTGTDIASSNSIVDQGLSTAAGVSPGTSAWFGYSASNAGEGKIPGDYEELLYSTLARCAIVDNSPGGLLRSSEFDNAAWVKTRTTVSANVIDSHIGTTSADRLIETASTNTHYISQVSAKSASDEDWSGSVFAKANTRSEVVLQIGLSSGTFAQVIVDLNTGTVLSGPTSVGTSNPRVYITNSGNGWYRINLIANIPASVTTTNLLLIGLANGGVFSYTGNGTSGIYIFGAGYAPISNPANYQATTTSTLISGVEQTGAALNLRGLPESTNGLLLPADQVEIITSRGSELKFVTAPLNSDTGGRGYLQFEPPLRGSVADGAAVIIHQPMGRFIFTGESPSWSNEPGVRSTASLEFEEA